MSDTRNFEDQLAVLLDQARTEAATLEELTAAIANGTELFRRFWGEMDRQEKTIEAFKTWFFERRPYMRDRLAQPPSFAGIRPPEPPADLNDRTATLADQLEAIRAGRVN